MDVVLGVAVTGPVARLALVDGSAAEQHDVIDQSTIELAPDPAAKLAAAIIGTHRMLSEDEHRLSATRVCWPDRRRAEQLRKTLVEAGLPNITTVSEPEAAVALVRNCAYDGGAAAHSSPKRHGDSALLFLDDDTATLAIVAADDRTTTVVAAEPVAGSDPLAACNTLLGRLKEEPGAADDLFLLGTSYDIVSLAKHIRAESPMPLLIPDEPDLALARGAALAGGFSRQAGPARGADGVGAQAGPDTIASAPNPQTGPQLAYSMVDDSGSLPALAPGQHYADRGVALQTPMAPLSLIGETDDASPDATPAARPRLLLLGSCVAAAVIIGFAALAVTVAIGIRPTATKQTSQQQLQHPMPTFLPQLPTNEVAPPQAPTAGPTAIAQQPPDASVGEAVSPGASGPAPVGPVAPAAPEAPPAPPNDPPPAADPPPGDGPPQINLPNIQLPPIIINLPAPGNPGQANPNTSGCVAGTPGCTALTNANPGCPGASVAPGGTPAGTGGTPGCTGAGTPPCHPTTPAPGDPSRPVGTPACGGTTGGGAGTQACPPATPAPGGSPHPVGTAGCGGTTGGGAGTPQAGTGGSTPAGGTGGKGLPPEPGVQAAPPQPKAPPPNPPVYAPAPQPKPPIVEPAPQPKPPVAQPAPQPKPPVVAPPPQISTPKVAPPQMSTPKMAPPQMSTPKIHQ